jgi:predicted nucleic acid-binding protein
MPADFFADSNVCLYILDKQSPKFDKAKSLLQLRPIISTQVVAENINVCLKKYKQPRAFALAHAHSLNEACEVIGITNQTLASALSIFEKYGYTIFDSLIIASALEAGCSTLNTEDLHHGQLINGKLKIINPFMA